MIKEGHFGFYEAYSLITIVLVTKIFYTSPLAIIRLLGTAAWLGTLISCCTALLFFVLLYFLMKRFPGSDLYHIFETVTGKFIGKILILIFTAYLVYFAGINLSEFIVILKIYTLPLSPSSFLIGAFLLITIVMGYVGLEGIARVSRVFVYPIIGGVILILLLAIPSYDFDYLKPYLGYGVQKTALVGLLRSSAYDEIVLLAVIIRSLHNVKLFKRVGFLSLLTTGLMLSASLMCMIASFQYTAGSEHISGMYQLTRVIYFSRFFQRVETLFLFVWIFSSLITVSFLFYEAISSYCRVFKITNHRPLLIPFAILIYFITMTPTTVTDLIEVHVMFVREYSIGIFMLIPLFVFAVAVIRRKKGVKSHAES
ncbi:endospore germination permease [Dehalobacter sp. DCM]|uniref:GerAB/ArcD/ProY family transporter n=1 Tax=Dehalobacter sp. DCM TaxID=2907827 RepID=UPI003081D1C4|nr:endospore germination permease [Dehalobacter sp. DCM]